MRGKQAPKRKIDPDPKYNSVTVAKFINTLMRKGKKSTATRVMYDALDALSESEKGGADPIELFERALKSVSPAVETRSRRVGGANYQIPQSVRPERRQALAFRWIIQAAQKKKGSSMAKRLATEFELAAKGEGDAVKKKQDVQKMAESNRAFAHFAR